MRTAELFGGGTNVQGIASPDLLLIVQHFRNDLARVEPWAPEKRFVAVGLFQWDVINKYHGARTV
ncbi:hypothetical protein BLA34_18255 [Ralstonia solanacearum]|nr:hypothetical protein BLA34_18255 [Ralstonia solanacearum]